MTYPWSCSFCRTLPVHLTAAVLDPLGSCLFYRRTVDIVPWEDPRSYFPGGRNELELFHLNTQQALLKSLFSLCPIPLVFSPCGAPHSKGPCVYSHLNGTGYCGAKQHMPFGTVSPKLRCGRDTLVVTSSNGATAPNGYRRPHPFDSVTVPEVLPCSETCYGFVSSIDSLLKVSISLRI